MNLNYDVIIIGAGQAGLSMGYYLKKSNLSFIILDGSKKLGESWRKRYDSLTLFTPRSYSYLPGMKLRGNQNGYPTKDEVADYLRAYADMNSLPLVLNTNVLELTLEEYDHCYKIVTDNGKYNAKNVVIATGPFQQPLVPLFSKELSDQVLQIHSSEYKNSNQLKDGSVLVVGGGNSGAQIASELSETRSVHLSVGHRMKFLPLNIGDKSIFWYFDKLGIYRANLNSFAGRYLRKQPDPIFGFELKTLIKNGTVALKPRTTSIREDTFLFEDGTSLKVDNVIWSTGFRSNYDWVKLSNVLNERGEPIQTRGIALRKGLYFLGLPWQSSRGSALIQGVGEDAEYIFKHILDRKK
ncbi:flavin-containing monooxygenase [Metabacillus idriensis]|uniref:flavin-containing monooxygenase n=1 Tax=Metabacillus idriensis TaxID=324768 RepID=UPI00174914F2|nr:NAD(P)-binding domain-containing protein [Metabacillus idriensis]